MKYCHYDVENNRLVVNLKIKTSAQRNSIDGLLDVNDKTYIKIALAEQREDGKANKLLIKFLSKLFGVVQKDFLLLSGARNSFKQIGIKNFTVDALKSVIDHYIST